MTQPGRFREARERISGDSWIDDLARASIRAAEAKFGPEHETYVTPVSFRVSIMPAACLKGPNDLRHWNLYVRGPAGARSLPPDGWLVTNNFQVLGKDGEWCSWPGSTAGLVAWLATCEHRTLGDALDAARNYAPKVTINGLTAVEVLARHRARNLECCRDHAKEGEPDA